MSKKDDMIAALEHRQPEGAVPLWELGFEHWDEWSGQHVVFGPEFEALTAAEQERALHRNAEIIISVSQEIGFAAVHTPNNFGEIAPGQLAYSILPGEARWEQIRILSELAPPDLLLVAGTGGVIMPPTSGQGYEEFAYQLYDNPDEIESRARNARDSAVEAAKRLRDLGVKIAVCAADIADNHGPYFTPAQMQRFILPYLQAWGENMRTLGLYSILHSDGNLYPILNELADSGIDGLQAVDPIAGMDMKRAKDIVGDRLCLCGNMDCGLLQFDPPEKVYAAARDLIVNCKPSGGFVLGGSNVIFREIPLKHYRAMLQAWCDYGRYY